MRDTCWIAAALALTCAPAAQADRAMSVGDGMPSAMRGAFVPRTPADASLPETDGADWQRAATHLDAVPASVLDAAASFTIAIVDTGADISSPTLAAKRPITYNVATRGPAITDAIGHGTFVASLAAAFSGQARLMIVQADRRGTFSDADEAAGIVWAVDHGARIINLSLSGSQTSATERTAIRYATRKGVLLVAAAGNGAQSGNRASYPAALIGREGLVVGASTPVGTRAPFSTTARYVDLLAPGVGVSSAVAAGAPNTLFTLAPATAGYGLGSGTSYSAPEVAGAAALVWAANPVLNASGVAAMLSSTASGHGAWSAELAYGTLDAGAAVSKALASVVPARTTTGTAGDRG